MAEKLMNIPGIGNNYGIFNVGSLPSFFIRDRIEYDFRNDGINREPNDYLGAVGNVTDYVALCPGCDADLEMLIQLEDGKESIKKCILNCDVPDTRHKYAYDLLSGREIRNVRYS